MKIPEINSTYKIFVQAGVTMLFLALIASACSSSKAESSVTPSAIQPPSTGVNLNDPAIKAAVSILADQYQIDPKNMALVEKLPKEWPNSCLGFEQPGVACAMEVVNGYRITITANQATYEVHTNLDGSQAVLIPGPIPSTNGVSFTTSENNICQTFLFSGYEDVAFGTCGTDLDPISIADDIRSVELEHYLSSFQPFSLNALGGYLNFAGTGSHQTTPAEKQSILHWAQLTLSELQSGTEFVSDQNDGLILSWHREGGLAGFCNDLSIYSTGRVVATDCVNGGTKLIGEDWLNNDQLGKIFQWEENLAWFEYGSPTNATADSMQIFLTFYGNGAEVAEKDRQNVAAFVQELYTQISEPNASLPGVQTGYLVKLVPLPNSGKTF